MLVYLIVNLANGKRYIGQTKHTLKQRKGNHISHALNRPGRPIEYAIREFGPEQFHFQKIKTCRTRAELDHWEEFYIHYYHTLIPEGYNVTLPSKVKWHFRIQYLREALILQRYRKIQEQHRQEDVTFVAMRPN